MNNSALLVAAVAALPLTAAAPVEVTRLTCQSLLHPTGIDVTAPPGTWYPAPLRAAPAQVVLPAARESHPPRAIGINWDAGTLVRVQNGTYGRMIRLGNGDILCSYEGSARSWVTRSRDNGKTWAEPVLIREIGGAIMANPPTTQVP